MNNWSYTDLLKLVEIKDKNIDHYLERITELESELERTRKAVDVAVERLELIAHETFQGEPSGINLGFHVRAAAALTDIDEIIKQEK